MEFLSELHGPVLFISLYKFSPKSYSMNRLIGIAGWVDVVDDESICVFIRLSLYLC